MFSGFQMKTRAKQIKGKRREELIERWLSGEEDPEWVSAT
jgi:hypothetical protein